MLNAYNAEREALAAAWAARFNEHEQSVLQQVESMRQLHQKQEDELRARLASRATKACLSRSLLNMRRIQQELAKQVGLGTGAAVMRERKPTV